MVDFTKEFDDNSYIDIEEAKANSYDADDIIDEGDDDLTDDELLGDEDVISDGSLDIEPSHLRTSNDVFKNSYLDGDNLKDNIHMSHKLSVEENYKDNYFDLYDIESIEYRAMERAIEWAKLNDDSIISIYNLINNPTQRMSKRKNRVSGVIEDIVIEEEFRLTPEAANMIFETFVQFFTSTIDRRKFFYVKFLVSVICNGFDFRVVSFDRSKGNVGAMKDCNATVSIEKGDRIECDRFYDMLTDGNKKYIKNNYF